MQESAWLVQFWSYSTLIINFLSVEKPKFFYTFFAPLKHSFHPGSRVFSKPKLKEIEAVATALALLWPEFRESYHFLATLVTGKRLVHLMNIILIMDFFLPIVSRLFFRMPQHYLFALCLCALLRYPSVMNWSPLINDVSV